MELLPEKVTGRLTGNQASLIITYAFLSMQQQEASQELTPERVLLHNFYSDKIKELLDQAEAFPPDEPTLPVGDLWMTIVDDAEALCNVPIATMAIRAQLCALYEVSKHLQLAYLAISSPVQS